MSWGNVHLAQTANRGNACSTAAENSESSPVVTAGGEREIQ